MIVVFIFLWWISKEFHSLFFPIFSIDPIPKSLLNKVPQMPTCSSALSAQVPKSPKCPSDWSAINPQVPECLSSVQVPSECPNAWVPFKSPPSTQRSFMLAFTLTFNEKHFSEMSFKLIIIRFLLIQWFSLFCACIISEKNIKIFLHVKNTLWDFQTIGFLVS